MLKPSEKLASFALSPALRALVCGVSLALILTAGCGGTEETSGDKAVPAAPQTETTGTIPAADESEPALATEATKVAKAGDPRIRLTWTTKSEDDAKGFSVYRCPTSSKFSCILINDGDPLPAKGTTSIPQEYAYYDLEVEADTDYWYRVGVHTSARVRGHVINSWIIGEEAPVKGHSRALTDEEAAEIRERGIHFRTELPPKPKTNSIVIPEPATR